MASTLANMFGEIYPPVWYISKAESKPWTFCKNSNLEEQFSVLNVPISDLKVNGPRGVD